LGLDAKATSCLAEWLKEPKNFFVFQGNAGTSKTYVLAAAVKFFYLNKPDRVHLDSNKELIPLPPHMRKFTEKSYYEWVKGNFDCVDYNVAMQEIADYDILIIDELGKTTATDWQVEQLFDLIDRRYNSMKPTMIASNFTFDELKDHYGHAWGRYLVSRLKDKGNCIIQDFESEDIRLGE
jgi:DNA replication protein DnaC